MKRPLAAPLLGLLFGIALSQEFAFSVFIYTLIFTLSCILLLIALFSKKTFLIHSGSAFIFLGVGALICTSSVQRLESTSTLSAHMNGEKKYLLGQVMSPCEVKGEGFQISVQAQAIKIQENWQRLGGGFLLKVGQGKCRFELGDVIQTWIILRSPEFFKNRYSFDYPFFLKTRGLFATAFVEDEFAVVKVGEKRSSLATYLIHLRKKIEASLSQVTNPASRNLLSALLLGQKKGLDPDTEDLFRLTGTTHLLVVSGLHLTLVGGIFYVFWRLVFSLWPPLLLKIRAAWWAMLFSIPIVGLYAVLVGFTPSVLRSVLTLLAIVFVVGLRRLHDSLGLLILAAFIILAISPLDLFDLSFQLSFLSLFSILLFVPRWNRFFLKKYEARYGSAPPHLFRIGSQILFASLAAQMGLLPLIVSRFHQISLVSLPANLLLVPLFGFGLMPLGMAGFLCSWVYPPFAVFLFTIAAHVFDWVLILLKLLSSIPFSAPYVAGFGTIQIGLYLILIGSFFLPRMGRKRLSIQILLILLNLFSWISPTLIDRFDNSLRLHFMDVGQGDGLLIELPHGKKMLVDAGGLIRSSFDLGERVLLPEFLSRGITHIDTFLLTHPHPDHYGGFQALLKVFHPREFLWNGEDVESFSFQELMREVQARGISPRRLDLSSPSFEIEGVRFEILYPLSEAFAQGRKDSATINNHSVVIRLDYQGFSALLSGDIQKETEGALLAGGKIQPAILLKIPHHGSDTSSTSAWVRAVCPEIGLIGVGAHNVFRFPRQKVLDRYAEIGTKIFRTDLDGEIDLEWKEGQLKISTAQGREEVWRPFSPNPAGAILKEPCREKPPEPESSSRLRAERE